MMRSRSSRRLRFASQLLLCPFGSSSQLPWHCVDAGPFQCFGSSCPSKFVSCEFLSRACSWDAYETLLDPAFVGTGLTLGDLCPMSCDLCDARCEQRRPVLQPPPRSPAELAAGRERPNNASCLVDQWIDAARAVHQSGAVLTRRGLARALLSVLDDEGLHLATCTSSRLICQAGRPRIQTWALQPPREQPLQSCPAAEDARPLRETPFILELSAAEQAEATLRPSTRARARRALRGAGLAVLVGALGGGAAAALRVELLQEAPRLRHVGVIGAERREHLLLEPEMPSVARALTALGVRAGAGAGAGGGRRHGVLAQLVPDGATVTELGAIIAHAGARAQRLHSDVEMHFGSATTITAFVSLQDTPAELGALRVAPASHTKSCRGDMEAFFSGTECGGDEVSGRPIAAPAGTHVTRGAPTLAPLCWLTGWRLYTGSLSGRVAWGRLRSAAAREPAAPAGAGS